MPGGATPRVLGTLLPVYADSTNCGAPPITSDGAPPACTSYIFPATVTATLNPANGTPDVYGQADFLALSGTNEENFAAWFENSSSGIVYEWLEMQPDGPIYSVSDNGAYLWQFPLSGAPVIFPFGANAGGVLQFYPGTYLNAGVPITIAIADPPSVPEPSSVALLADALLGLVSLKLKAAKPI